MNLLKAVLKTLRKAIRQDQANRVGETLPGFFPGFTLPVGPGNFGADCPVTTFRCRLNNRG
jgi:uncharacterized protein (DUF2267 family)